MKSHKGCGSSETGKKTSDSSIADETRFTTDPEQLKPRGRLQFFFHSPVSDLPVRDVLNRQGHGHKREPYIEQRAENYCNRCYQDNNIVPFLESQERYLFLTTTCKKEGLPQHDSRQIVGVLEKEVALDRGGHYAVQGAMSLYRFEDSFPLVELHDSPKQIRMLKLDEEETGRVLDHFSSGEDVYDQCCREVEDLKQQAGDVAIPAPERDELFDESASGDCGGNGGC